MAKTKGTRTRGRAVRQVLRIRLQALKSVVPILAEFGLAVPKDFLKTDAKLFFTRCRDGVAFTLKPTDRKSGHRYGLQVPIITRNDGWQFYAACMVIFELGFLNFGLAFNPEERWIYFYHDRKPDCGASNKAWARWAGRAGIKKSLDGTPVADPPTALRRMLAIVDPLMQALHGGETTNKPAAKKIIGTLTKRNRRC